MTEVVTLTAPWKVCWGPAGAQPGVQWLCRGLDTGPGEAAGSTGVLGTNLDVPFVHISVSRIHTPLQLRQKCV